MTTLELKIILPDQLAKEARQAGLLTPEAMEAMLRDRLKAQRVDELFEAMDRMAAVDTLLPMSESEIQSEIEAYRAEKRVALVPDINEPSSVFRSSPPKR